MFQYELQELEAELAREKLEKIAILGLGNAGKTSIIKLILYEFDAFMTLLPTKGIDRTNIEFLGRELTIWDFGGQDRYRNQYLVHPDRYFCRIRYLYYIVDLQDYENLRQSMAYFYKCVSLANHYSKNPKVYLFFHKFDPNYQGSLDFGQVESEFLNEVLAKIQSMGITPVVFHTSIFEPMGVISSFSQPLLGNDSIYATLCKTLEQLAVDLGLNFAILRVNNFEIGSFFKNKQDLNHFNTILKDYHAQMEHNMGNPVTFGFSEIHTFPFEIEVGPTKFGFQLIIAISTLEDEKHNQNALNSIDEFLLNLRKILRNSEIIRIGILRTEAIKIENPE